MSWVVCQAKEVLVRIMKTHGSSIRVFPEEATNDEAILQVLDSNKLVAEDVKV